MTHEITAYTSYLVRVWQQSRPDQPARPSGMPRPSTSRPVSGAAFSIRNELWAFLTTAQPGEHDE